MPTPPSPATSKPRFAKNMANYQTLVDAFRQHPDNVRAVARTTGFNRAACQLAWERGWDKLGLPGAGPIRDVIRADVEKAKIAAAERAKKERDLADAEIAKKRAEAIAALEAEADLLSSNRRGLLSLSKTVEKMVGILPLYALRVQEAVAQEDPQNPGKLIAIKNPAVSLDQAMKVIQSIGLTANRVAYATAAFVELARLDRGQSTVNVAEADLAEDVEVLEELRAGATLYDRLKAAAEEAEPEDEGEPPPGSTLQ